ncbi:fatty acid desaturase [Sorangium sp. So ce1099]|uniref:fatty acid desaturase n=1 Tax=Sorangium sp. So ce1099 TaxID=3133331 RepID=UPI003F631F22
MRSFEWVTRAEPHRARRRRIVREHPEIRALFGYDRRTIAVTLAVVLAQFAVAWWLGVLAARWWVVTLAAATFGAVLSHWCAMAIHEAAHDLAARRVRSNKLLALIANLPMVLPVAMSFRRYHLAHHALLGVAGEDTDLPRLLEVRLIGAGRARKLLWLFFYVVAYLGRAARFAKLPSRDEWINLAIQLPAAWLSWRLLGAPGFTYLLLSTLIGHSLHPVAGHFVHEHYVYAPGQETYSYYGPLNHVTFNVGYHVEHHDFMNVPGWRLPALHRIAKGHYGTLVSHRSWTWVLWHFITNPAMGPHARIVRSRAVHDGVVRRSIQVRESDGGARKPIQRT